MSDQTEDSASKMDIDWVRTLAAALAAVSSAVVLSTLGAVGTVIGAALGSVVASVGTAIYAQGLARSKERVARAQTSALSRISLAQGEVERAQSRGAETPTGEAHLEQAAADLQVAERRLDEASEDAVMPPWRERLAALPWKRIGILAAGVFLVTVVVISSFELLTGRSVSSYTGGSDSSSRTTFFGSGPDVVEERREQQEPSQQEERQTPPADQDGSGTSDPTPADPEETTPTEEASPTDDPGPADDPAPSESPSPTTPSESPSGTPSPTAPSPTE